MAEAIKPVESTVGSFPSPTVPNYDKDKSYFLAYLKGMFNNWTTNGAGGNYANRSRKLYAQSYRLGMQDPTMLKNLLNLKGEITEINVDYTPITIVSKFADLMVNNILNSKFKVKIELADLIATEKKDAFRTDLKKAMVGKNISKLISDISGIDVNPKVVPADEEDIDLIMEVDYRDNDEISLSTFLKTIKNTNDFEDSLRENINDLIQFNEMALDHRIDMKEGIMIEYVSDINLIRSTSKEMSNKNLQYAGEVKTITFADLRTMMTAADGLTDDDINEMAKFVAVNSGGFSSNTDWNSPIYKDQLYGINRWYDELSLDIVVGKFVDVNYDLWEKKETKYGTWTMHLRDKKYIPPKESAFKREVFTDTYQTVYKGTWIKGTDYVIDFGRADNVLIQGKDLSRARLPYSIYTIQGKSMVERMIPFATQMWISHLKHQQLMAKLRPAGISINKSALEEALLMPGDSGNHYQPLDLLDYYDQTGNIIYRDDTEDDGIPRRGEPIKQIDNRMGSQLTELTAIYNQNLQQIRDMTNVSQFMDGSQVSSKTLVGVQEKGIEQSNMGIDHLRAAHDFLIKDSAKVCIMMMQDIFKYSSLRDAYAVAIGEYSMDIIERLKDIPIEQINISIEYGMTDKDKAQLDADINASIKAKELRMEDGIMIREIDNIRLANKMLKKRREVYRQELKEERNEIHQQTLDQEKAKRETETSKVEAETSLKAKADIMVYSEKADIDKEADIQKQADLMAQIRLKGEWSVKVAEAKANSEMAKVDKLEDGKNTRITKTKTLESENIDQKQNNTGPKDFEKENGSVKKLASEEVG